MKKLLFALMAVMAAMTVNAQIVKDLEYPRAHFGIRAAFTYNSLKTSDDYVHNTTMSYTSTLPFVSAGLAADFRVCPLPIYFETGLYYVNRGGNDGVDIDFGVGHVDYDYERNNNCIDIPILASYHLYFTDNMSIQPFFGPYFGYGIDRETIDYGMRIGLGWNFGRLYANIGYDYGYEVDGWKSNTFFATVGFNIGGKY